MDRKISKLSLYQLLFVIFAMFTASAAMASGYVVSVNAGGDQLVNAGDTVMLSGAIDFEKDKHHKKHHKHKIKRHSHNYYFYGRFHYKKHARHKHGWWKRDLSIIWTQTAGTTVALMGADTLTPSFVAPDPDGLNETLVFELAVYDDGELLASDTVNVDVQTVASTLAGRITAVDGAVLSDVTVDVLSSGMLQDSVVSGVNGEFNLEFAANREVVLYLHTVGYADQVVPVKTPDVNGNIFLDITMLMRGEMQTFPADTDSTISGSDGATVSVTAGSFVDANGQPVTGDIDVSVTPVDISRPASLAAFPGEFSGVQEGDVSDTPIISLGAVEFEFSQNGQPLQLAAGQMADVIIPIYISTYQDGSSIAVGDLIPLWSLNEETGIWQQEGFGTVIASPDSPTGLAMQASVSHFSWWNCDVSMNAAQAIVTVIGPDAGTALVKARTNADIGWRPNTVETVATVGTATAPLYIPSNGEVCFWAEVSLVNGFTGTTAEVCVTAAPNSLINVDLYAPVEGPVDIVSQPMEVAGAVEITGYSGYPVNRVQLYPITNETTVSYTVISGVLPTGLSLNMVNAIRAEIAGVTTETGSFSVVVQATDADGYVDNITINYTVTADVPPPELEPWINLQYTMGSAIFDLNDYNNGGPASSWTLSYNPQWEQVPPPPSVSLDPATGILTVTESCVFWDGLVIATNASGTSETGISISDGSCQ